MMRYNYDELRAKALETRDQEDIKALVDWLAEFDPDSWNGEYYDIDDGWTIREVLEPDVIDDDGEVSQWEIF